MKNLTTTIKSASIRKLLTILSFLISSNLVEASPKIEFLGMAAHHGSLLGRILVPHHVRIHGAEANGAKCLYLGIPRRRAGEAVTLIVLI